MSIVLGASQSSDLMIPFAKAGKLLKLTRLLFFSLQVSINLGMAYESIGNTFRFHLGNHN